MTANRSNCAFCSLLCSSDDAVPSLAERCHLRAAGLARRKLLAGALPSAELIASQVEQLLRSAHRPLIWVEGADLAAMRAAIQLAQTCQSTIHVAEGLGDKAVTNVAMTDGWFGTTLAEVANHAQLVITLGTHWIELLPLLAERFLSPHNGQLWWSITLPEQSLPDPALRPHGSLSWSRKHWDRELCLLLAQNSASPDSQQLALAIRHSANTAIVWEKSEFNQPEDEMLIHRLWNLAHQQNQIARLGLLALDGNVGRETARSCLLWMTGCLTTARRAASGWISPDHYRHYGPADWRAEFDAIIVIDNSTWQTPQSDIGADFVITSSPLLNPLEQKSSGPTQKQQGVRQCYQVGLAGVDHDSLLFRADQGTVCCVRAPASTQPGVGLPNAADILRLATELANRAEVI
jgi:hypothetical protein